MLLDQYYNNQLNISKVRQLALAVLCLIIIVSVETFNTVLSGASDSEALQTGADVRAQVAAVMLWALLIGLTFLPGVARFPVTARGLLWPCILLAWTVASPIWSSDPANGVPKAVVLLASSLAAWRMTSVITAKEMFACVFHSLAILLVVSMLLVIFVPSVGLLVHDWQHEGQWRGIFGTKQGLGAVAAVFLVLAFLRISRQRNWFNFITCAIGLACLLGSGSRGAGIVAAVAAICIFVAKGRPKVATLVTYMILLGLAFGTLEIIYFAATGLPSIQIFGSDINLTERTYIWQYAVTHWTDVPFLGFGLNGFWTDTGTAASYMMLHGWVLDNYHSGYLAIVVETGAIGFGLFCVISWKLVSRLRYLLVHATSNRLSLDMTLGFFVVFFTINLTETFFLRSTNFFSVLFTFLMTKIFLVPDLSSIPMRSRTSRPLRSPLLHRSDFSKQQKS